MRFINQAGTVVKSRTVTIGPGGSATLEYRGSGPLPGAGRDVRTLDQRRLQRPADRAWLRSRSPTLSCSVRRLPGSSARARWSACTSVQHAVTDSGCRRQWVGPHIRRIVLGLTSALALSLPAGVSAVPGPDPYATCRERFAQQPDDYESAYCFYQVTIDERRWDEGARVFDDLIAAHPGNLWLPLAYGHVYRTRDPNRAERLYRQAADGFRASAGAEGELLARSNLRDLLFPFGRVDEATREMARVVEIGDASEDPILKAQAWSLQARHIYESGGDLGHAFRLLKQAESAAFPQGPYRLKRGDPDPLGDCRGRLRAGLTKRSRSSVASTRSPWRRETPRRRRRPDTTRSRRRR